MSLSAISWWEGAKTITWAEAIWKRRALAAVEQKRRRHLTRGATFIYFEARHTINATAITFER